MDGMYSDGNFKTKCCNKKPIPYQAETYPYDSGWACPKCNRQWSELQIARNQHLKKEPQPHKRKISTKWFKGKEPHE